MPLLDKPRKRKEGGIITRVTHRVTKREGVVRLDKSTMTFFALDPDIDETPDTRGTIACFESKDGREVESWLDARLAKRLKPDEPMKWLPVIEVKVSDHGDWRFGSRRRRASNDGDQDQERETSVTAEIDRYFIALTLDKKEWRKLEWHQVIDGSSTQVAVEDQLATSRGYGRGPKATLSEDQWERDNRPAFSLPSITNDRSIVPYTDNLWLGLNQLFDNLDGTVKTIQEMLGSKKGLGLIAEVGAGVKRLSAGAPTVTDKEG